MNNEKLYMKMSTSNRVPTYNIAILGDSGTGKSAFIMRQSTGTFPKQHIKTTNINAIPITLYVSTPTYAGPVILNVREVSIPEQVGPLMHDTNGVVIFGDASKESVGADHWALLASRLAQCPMVICANKWDLAKIHNPCDTGCITAKHLNVPFYQFSAKHNHNHEAPFLSLLRALMHPELTIRESPALVPPEVHLDTNEMENWIRENPDVNCDTGNDSGSDEELSVPPERKRNSIAGAVVGASRMLVSLVQIQKAKL